MRPRLFTAENLHPRQQPERGAHHASMRPRLFTAENTGASKKIEDVGELQ